MFVVGVVGVCMVCVWLVGVVLCAVRVSFVCRSCLVELGSQVNAWICAAAPTRDLQSAHRKSMSVMPEQSNVKQKSGGS